MSQALTKKNLARTSLRSSRTARTVLLRMAQDQARGERLHELKNRLPGVTWRQIGDAIHVSERSVQAWAAGGGMEYKHAELLASFFRKKGLDVDADYIWRGPKTDTPDLLAINGNGGGGSQLDRIERRQSLILQNQERILTLLTALALSAPDVDPRGELPPFPDDEDAEPGTQAG